MKSVNNTSVINNSLQGTKHLTACLSVVDECREVGMLSRSIINIIENIPEAIAEAQAIIDTNNCEQLG